MCAVSAKRCSSYHMKTCNLAPVSAILQHCEYFGVYSLVKQAELSVLEV